VAALISFFYAAATTLGHFAMKHSWKSNAGSNEGLIDQLVEYEIIKGAPPP
jgi:hypothetical protein